MGEVVFGGELTAWPFGLDGLSGALRWYLCSSVRVISMGFL